MAAKTRTHNSSSPTCLPSYLRCPMARMIFVASSVVLHCKKTSPGFKVALPSAAARLVLPNSAVGLIGIRGLYWAPVLVGCRRSVCISDLKAKMIVFLIKWDFCRLGFRTLPESDQGVYLHQGVISHQFSLQVN